MKSQGIWMWILSGNPVVIPLKSTRYLIAILGSSSNDPFLAISLINQPPRKKTCFPGFGSGKIQNVTMKQ